MDNEDRAQGHRRHTARGAVTRRQLLVGTGLGFGALALSGPASAAQGYSLRSRSAHDALDIAWGYPFDHRVERRKGVDGYPGEYYDGHKGVDFYTSPTVGVVIHSVARGIVKAVKDEGEGSNSRGQHVVIQHAGGITSEYAHLTRGSQQVRVGMSVERGTPLGKTGWTGTVRPKLASNAHLHLAIKSYTSSGLVVWNPVWLVDGAPLANSEINPPSNGDEMPEYVYKSTTQNQGLGTGWTALFLEGTDRSLVSGGIVNAVFHLRVEGLGSGGLAQFRYYLVDDTAGSNPTPLAVADVVGTGASTNVELNISTNCGTSKRLRLEGLSTVSGARVTSVKARALKW